MGRALTRSWHRVSGDCGRDMEGLRQRDIAKVARGLASGHGAAQRRSGVVAIGAPSVVQDGSGQWLMHAPGECRLRVRASAPVKATKPTRRCSSASGSLGRGGERGEDAPGQPGQGGSGLERRRGGVGDWVSREVLAGLHSKRDRMRAIDTRRRLWCSSPLRPVSFSRSELHPRPSWAPFLNCQPTFSEPRTRAEPGSGDAPISHFQSASRYTGSEARVP